MRMKIGVASIVFLLLCSGFALAQTEGDVDDEDTTSTQPSVQQSTPPAAPSVPAAPSLKEARKVVRERCAAEIRTRTSRPTGDDRRNALLVCSTKASYDCAVRMQEQKVQQKAKRLEFMDGCLRSAGKS